MTKLGQFRVKEEDDGASSLKPGALFFSRINKTSSGACGDGVHGALGSAPRPTPEISAQGGEAGGETFMVSLRQVQSWS